MLDEIRKKELKNRVESLLFSSGKKMHLQEICKLARANEEDIKLVLIELQQDYGSKDSSLSIIEEGESWKIIVKEKYLPFVKKIVTETELSKSLMETLAYIAFKYPIKQCDLIKIRSNKAYEHLTELEAAGYITRQKHGRTKLIKLTERFFNYFELPQEKLKEKFKDFESIATAIKEKEKETEMAKDEQKKKEQDLREKKDARERTDSLEPEFNGEPEIDLVDEKGKKVKLELVEEQQSQIEVEEEKLGGLEVIDEPEEKEEPEEEKERQEDELKKIREEVKEEEGKKQEETPEQKKKEEEQDEKAEKRAKEILEDREDKKE